MIRNLKSKPTRDIFDGVISRSSKKIPIVLHDKARRQLDQINAATAVETLRVPPGNNLEKLKGNLQDYWSIRINKQRRIIFRWENGHAFDVDI